MRITKFFRPLCKCQRTNFSLPIVSRHTGVHHYCIVSAYKLPCGRTIWVVPCAAAFVHGSFNNLLNDAVFQSANDLFKHLSLGGWNFSLDMSRKCFYNVLGVDYRNGYNCPSCK